MFGCSFDAPETNATFKENNSFPYRLLADEERELGLHLGATDNPKAVFANRVTAVIDPSGYPVIRYEVSLFSPACSIHL